MSLLTDLDEFYLDYRRCDDLRAGVVDSRRGCRGLDRMFVQREDHTAHGGVTVRHAEVIYRDDIRWVVEIIRNPDGVVEQQHEFSTYTAAVDVFSGLVEKYAVAAWVA